MFGTLSYDAHNQEPVFEAVTTLPNSISGTEPPKRGSAIHKACQLCRARKLRCSGEPSGCERCKSSFNICKYPPRTSRAGRKRDLASPTSSSSKSHEYPVEEGVASDQRGTLRDRRSSQLEWQPDPTSGGFADQDTLALSAYKLFEADCGLASPHAPSFLGDGYVLSNPEDYNTTKDYFDIPWHDHNALRSKRISDPSNLPDLCFDLSKGAGNDTIPPGLTSPGVVTPDIESLDMSGATAAIGRAWSVTSVDRTPELSSSNSLSRSHSVEPVGACTGTVDANYLGDGENCQCLSRVALFLEQVETGSAKPNISIDDLLECSREPLRLRKALLACVNCNSRSEYILLLTMLAKSLSVVCYELVQRCTPKHGDGEHEVSFGTAWPDLRLGTYLVQDSAEKSTIMEALITAKLDHLLDFITVLKTRAEKREGLLVSLSQAEERIKELKFQLSPMF